MNNLSNVDVISEEILDTFLQNTHLLNTNKDLNIINGKFQLDEATSDDENDLHQQPIISSLSPDQPSSELSESLKPSSLASILPLSFIASNLLSLPVLLPSELDQLLNDNDALINVIHGLHKHDRILDAIPYIEQLEQNLSVLLYHQEIYIRSCEQNGLQIALQIDSSESLLPTNETMQYINNIANKNSQKTYLPSLNNGIEVINDQNHTQALVKMSIALYHYTLSQVTRAQGITSISNEVSAEEQIENNSIYKQTMFKLMTSRSAQISSIRPIFNSKPLISKKTKESMSKKMMMNNKP